MSETSERIKALSIVISTFNRAEKVVKIKGQKSSIPARDHPFKTSACLRGGGVKNWPNLPTDSSKKMPTERGRGQKS